MFIQMLSSGPAWLVIILLVTVSLLPDVLKKVLCRQLWPSATERIQVRAGRGCGLRGGAGRGWGGAAGCRAGLGRGCRWGCGRWGGAAGRGWGGAADGGAGLRGGGQGEAVGGAAGWGAPSQSRSLRESRRGLCWETWSVQGVLLRVRRWTQGGAR